MRVTINKPTEVDVKTVRIHANVGDALALDFYDADWTHVGGQVGCVPAFFPGDHCGDDLELTIDLETGQITNWKKPSTEALARALSPGGDE